MQFSKNILFKYFAFPFPIDAALAFSYGGGLGLENREPFNLSVTDGFQSLQPQCNGIILIHSGKPQIEYDQRYKTPQQIRGGTSLVYQVDFTGVPTPTASWSHDGAPLTKDARVSIDTTEYYTTLTVKGMKREDVGMYAVEVKNKAGSASASFEAKIRGKYQ